MISVFCIVSCSSNGDPRCLVGDVDDTNRFVFVVLPKYQLVPSIILTACCPFNRIRKEKITRVIRAGVYLILFIATPIEKDDAGSLSALLAIQHSVVKKGRELLT